jgi:CDP-6-deoxy-D-xylo-4-hexulose-3-dehydrase
MQAACGLAQLEKAAIFIEKRRKNFKFLKERLRTCEEFLQLPVATEKSDPSWFGFPITIKENSPVSRLELTTYLDQQRIGTRLLFAGNLTRQPYMANLIYRISGTLEHTDNVMSNTFWIGVQPSLTEEMLEYVATQIEVYLGVGF